MIKNIVLTDSVLSVFEELDKPTWLAEKDSFDVEEVGGIHNLSFNDKERWVRKLGNEGLRIIERDTGREEVWFGHKTNYPRFITVDKDGNLQSHSKFQSVWVPAMHFPSDSLIGHIEARYTVIDGFPNNTSLSIWCADGDISCLPGEETHALVSKGMVHKPKDKRAKDIISYFYFDEIKEFWYGGSWMSSEFKGFKMIFLKKELNDPETRVQMDKWINHYCKHPLHPFGEDFFVDPEEEFLFVSEFCT